MADAGAVSELVVVNGLTELPGRSRTGRGSFVFSLEYLLRGVAQSVQVSQLVVIEDFRRLLDW